MKLSKCVKVIALYVSSQVDTVDRARGSDILIRVSMLKSY